MHLKRWLTAVIALPLLVLLICKGGAFLFAIFIAAVCLITMWEYYRIVVNKTGEKALGIIPIWGLVTGLFIIGAAYEKSLDIALCMLALNMLICGFFTVFQYGSGINTLNIAAKQIQGVIYIPVFLSSLVLLRNSEDGVTWIFLLLVLVFSGDTGAFYFGTFFGKRKLCPLVSPGKTVEGAIGGLFISVLAGLVFRHYFLSEMSFGLSICFFICIGIAAPVGDLFESVLKREGEIKDSGSILPGHGGILDRIDALLFAAPVAYLFKGYIL